MSYERENSSSGNSVRAENLDNTVSSTCEIGTRTRREGEGRAGEGRNQVCVRGLEAEDCLRDGMYRVWWMEKGAGGLSN